MAVNVMGGPWAYPDPVLDSPPPGRRPINVLGAGIDPAALQSLAGMQLPSVGSVNQARSQSPAQPHRSFGDTLGQIGDILALMGHGTPIYGAIQARKQQQAQDQQFQNALAQWMANPEDQAAWQQAVLANPEKAAAILESLHKGDFTLSEDQVRYGAGGREVARGLPGSKIVTTEAGGAAGVFTPSTGGYKPLIVPNDGSQQYGTPAGSGGNLPRVSSPDEARRLPPGTRFMLPDGRIGTVPGGGASNGTGGFRNIPSGNPLSPYP